MSYYDTRDVEHCTCPWPTIEYLCPINPDRNHFVLELFALVPLETAKQRVIEHMVRDHNPGWNMHLTLAMQKRRHRGMPDDLVPASIARLIVLTNQKELVEPGYEMLITFSA